jgi:hypothetical protein
VRGVLTRHSNDDTVGFFQRHAQMIGMPARQRLGDLRLEEDAVDSGGAELDVYPLASVCDARAPIQRAPASVPRRACPPMEVRGVAPPIKCTKSRCF